MCLAIGTHLRQRWCLQLQPPLLSHWRIAAAKRLRLPNNMAGTQATPRKDRLVMRHQLKLVRYPVPQLTARVVISVVGCCDQVYSHLSAMRIIYLYITDRRKQLLLTTVTQFGPRACTADGRSYQLHRLCAMSLSSTLSGSYGVQNVVNAVLRRCLWQCCQHGPF